MKMMYNRKYVTNEDANLNNNIEKRNRVGMVSMETVWEICTIFVSTFLIAQIFILTDGDMVAAAVFKVAKFLMLFVFNVVSTLLMTKMRAVWLSRISALAAFGFLATIIIRPEMLVSHTLFLGLLWGTINGLYYGP